MGRRGRKIKKERRGARKSDRGKERPDALSLGEAGESAAE